MLLACVYRYMALYFTSIQLIQPMSELVNAKLEDGNFLTWKQHVLKAIRRYCLENFIIETSTVSSQLVNGESGL